MDFKLVDKYGNDILETLQEQTHYGIQYTDHQVHDLEEKVNMYNELFEKTKIQHSKMISRLEKEIKDCRSELDQINKSGLWTKIKELIKPRLKQVNIELKS